MLDSPFALRTTFIAYGINSKNMLKTFAVADILHKLV